MAKRVLRLKEIEYFGQVRSGHLYERVEKLVEDVLSPLEEEWEIKEKAANAVGRVKDLRTAILRDMVHGNISDEERQRRWQQLAACYYAQQISHYPRDYVTLGKNVPEHVLETVERFEEDLTDHARPHGPMHAVVQIGEVIEITGKRERRAGTDPVMKAIKSQLTSMLAQLATEAGEY